MANTNTSLNNRTPYALGDTDTMSKQSNNASFWKGGLSNAMAAKVNLDIHPQKMIAGTQKDAASRLRNNVQSNASITPIASVPNDIVFNRKRPEAAAAAVVLQNALVPDAPKTAPCFGK